MAYGRRTTRRAYRKRGVRKTTPFKRVNTRAMVAKAKTKSLVKLIKGVTLKQSETCYKSRSVARNNFYHDTMADIVIWDEGSTSIFPQQGTGDGERRGDEIYVTGIMYRGIFQIPHDRRNTVFKMWYLPYNINNSLTQSTFFHNITGNTMLDPVQTDRWSGVRYLGKFRVKSTDQNTDAANPEDKTIMVKRWIPIKRKVTFQSDGTQSLASGLKPRGVLVICAYDSITTLTTDIVMTYSENCFTLYYKDP